MFASILWIVYSLFFLSTSLSIVTTNDSIFYFKVLSLISVVFMLGTGIYMSISALKLRKWLKYRTMRKSLLALLLQGRNQVPLAYFADLNRVKLTFAQKYIDSILHHFNGRLDIDIKGIIRYENIYTKGRIR